MKNPGRSLKFPAGVAVCGYFAVTIIRKLDVP